LQAVLTLQLAFQIKLAPYLSPKLDVVTAHSICNRAPVVAERWAVGEPPAV
jgi:hypothetical protein